uniref:Methionine synthase n=1 Tax=Moorena producens (strain JHB) TaxID=1454205 RepID=A0A1D9G709_MOOP1
MGVDLPQLTMNKIVLERLKQHIIDSESIGLEEALEEALKDYSPRQIINTCLLQAMRTVGELYGSREIPLPSVIKSAETKKTAVAYLETHMDKEEADDITQGKCLIATVEGDLHDLGKNLVDIILSSNGYKVINLGINQPVDNILKAYEEHQPDCIAMSGLLIKTMAVMKDNLEIFNQKGITVPVILGGAALTPKFVEKDCKTTYKGQVVYGKNAFVDWHFMDKLMAAKAEDNWDDLKGFLDEETSPPPPLTLEEMGQMPFAEANQYKLYMNDSFVYTEESLAKESSAKKSVVIDTKRSHVVTLDVERPTPPFWGTQVLKDGDISIEDIYPYVDVQLLYVGRWRFRKLKDQSQEDYNEFLATKAYGILEEWKEKVIADDLIHPAAIYGYFPCNAEGNTVYVYDPQDHNKLLTSFEFPRQRVGKRLCIADFYATKESGQIDVFPMQIVTAGEIGTTHAQKLFEADNYLDYHYYHGVAMQMADAIADWLHARIRKELGFGAEEPDNITDIMRQRYRGSRYSFGYPACPNMADQFKQMDLLDTSRIDVYMNESEHLLPEQSTTAFVAHHPVAKYFNT